MRGGSCALGRALPFGGVAAALDHVEANDSGGYGRASRIASESVSVARDSESDRSRLPRLLDWSC
jgi:hypothetical protein